MVASRTHSGDRPPVAIVGRGPVGMTLALRLAGFGIPTVLIDTLGEEISPGSKAVVMHQHAVEVLSTVGVGEQMLREGIAWTVGRTFLGTRPLFEARMDVAPGQLPRVLNVPQARTEELLLEQVLACPLITTKFRRTLVGLEQDGASCRLTLAAPDGATETVTADWVAGCDGSRSATRKLLGIPFRGNAHEDVYLINDIVAKLPFPNERRFYFKPPFNPRGTVLIHPQGPDQWHIDFQVGQVATDRDEPVEDEATRDRRIASVIGTTEFEVVWSTSYRFKHLVADRFRVGRVFLVGDAAHLVSPYGARGLNSGLADADNLAWRLAAVINDGADPSLLDGYEAERRPVAVENLRITGTTAKFMSPLTRRQRWRRDLVLALAARFDGAKRLVNNGRFYEPPRYGAPSDSPEACAVGTLVPDAPVHTATGEARLARLLAEATTVLLVPAAGDDPAPALAQATALADAGHRCLVLARPGAPAVDDPAPALLRLADRADWWPHAPVDGALALLVRPDRYVHARRPVAGGWSDLEPWVRAEKARLVPGATPHHVGGATR